MDRNELEEFRKEWYAVYKKNYLNKQCYTMKLYEAFEKMHKQDGTTKGSRWQNEKRKK